MIKEVYPSNKEHFEKLKQFGKTLLAICKKAKIEPILYGSYMLFYYTNNKKIKINDLDFYIREKEFTKLIKSLNKNKIKYFYSPEFHTLQVFTNKLKIEFDSIDFWYNDRKKFININFDGFDIKALSKGSLKNIYKKASEKSKDNPEGNRRKYKMLTKLK